MCECSGMSHHSGVTQDKGISPRGPFQGGFSPGQLPRLPQQTSAQRSSLGSSRAEAAAESLPRCLLDQE